MTRVSLRLNFLFDIKDNVLRNVDFIWYQSLPLFCIPFVNLYDTIHFIIVYNNLKRLTLLIHFSKVLDTYRWLIHCCFCKRTTMVFTLEYYIESHQSRCNSESCHDLISHVQELWSKISYSVGNLFDST